MIRLCVAAVAASMACGPAFAQGRLPTPTLGSASISGASPTVAGASIFEITNSTAPVTGNALAFEVSDSASYDIPTFGSTVRPRIFETTLNVPTGVTSTTIHENFWSSNHLTGGGTSGVEINQFHAYFQNDMTGSVTGNVEGFESSALNNGTIGGYQDFLGLFHNGASATVNSAFAFKAQLTNDNATAASVAAWAGLDCEAMVGSGSHPTFEYCIRNANSKGVIASAGPMVVGSLSPSNALMQIKGVDILQASVGFRFSDSAGTSWVEMADDGSTKFVGKVSIGTLVPSSFSLLIKGPDQSSATSALGIQDGTGADLFRVFDDGVVAAQTRMVVGALSAGSSLFTVKGSDQLAATVAINALDGTGQSVFQVRDDASTAVYGKLSVGTLSTGSGMLSIKGADQLNATVAFLISDSASAPLFQVHDDGTIITLAQTAVSCSVGTLNTATAVVTNGLITHC